MTSCFQEPVFISIIGVTLCQRPVPRMVPPGLLSHQLRGTSYSSRCLREGSHWPTLESCVQPEPITASAILSLARPESHVHPEQSEDEGRRLPGLGLHGRKRVPRGKSRWVLGWQSLSL